MTILHVAAGGSGMPFRNFTIKLGIFFPGCHPVRGVQVMKVGKLQLHQGMFPQAMKNLRLAFDIMRVTHGREHRLIEDLILLLEECDANIRAS
ncbi:SET and MYND domain-containing protein 3 [Myotis brandtii]|uniref:SET and MYND domain-containing protein 3 n=1 Tax=Myotis brandtii TaxID=109478 RepID=S7NFZ5_MYOBR|nr:SET and MYND domain-containing protein 3 [Myotis brandtii]